MSVKIMGKVWELPSELPYTDKDGESCTFKLTPTRKYILLALADHANEDGMAWPSQRGLAEKCDVARTTVNECLTTAARAGLLSITHQSTERGIKDTSIYAFRLPMPKREPKANGRSPDVAAQDIRRRAAQVANGHQASSEGHLPDVAVDDISDRSPDVRFADSEMSVSPNPDVPVDDNSTYGNRQVQQPSGTATTTARAHVREAAGDVALPCEVPVVVAAWMERLKGQQRQRLAENIQRAHAENAGRCQRALGTLAGKDFTRIDLPPEFFWGIYQNTPTGLSESGPEPEPGLQAETAARQAQTCFMALRMDADEVKRFVGAHPDYLVHRPEHRRIEYVDGEARGGLVQMVRDWRARQHDPAAAVAAGG